MTGVIAAAVFLPLVIFGELPFALLVYAIGILALFELLRMKGLKLISAPGIISMLLLAVLLCPSQYDLLIRTSGEIRLSNFMLWQLAYSEFLFTDVLWPDFKDVHLLQAIGEYQRRGRRFGGI
ncbi:hypothetical protein DT075_25655 [Bacillus licheniformis]|nr:hypothetical protein DT075_25655 [Bacillus licheniformis]